MPGGLGEVSYGGSFALGVSGTPAAIPGLTEADDDDLEVNQVKVGALDDLTRFYAFKNGRITGGKLKLKYQMQRSSANYGAFNALLGTDDLTYVLTLPDGSTHKGLGNLSKLSKNKLPEDDRITFNVEVTISTHTWTQN